MKLIKFIWCLIKHLVIYTLSVIPASCRDAWDETFRGFGTNIRHHDNRNYPVKFENAHEGHHHRRRRGHRGGKKHHHNNSHH